MAKDYKTVLEERVLDLAAQWDALGLERDRVDLWRQRLDTSQERAPATLRFIVADLAIEDLLAQREALVRQHAELAIEHLGLGQHQAFARSERLHVALGLQLRNR